MPRRSDSINFVFGQRAFLGYRSQPTGRPAWFANLPTREYVSTAEARAVAPEDWLARLREAYALKRFLTPDKMFGWVHG